MNNKTKINQTYISTYRNEAVRKYKSTWGRGIMIQGMPKGITKDNLDIVLNTMIDTGYTFIASYCFKFKNSDVISIDNITLPDMTSPSIKTINRKMKLMTVNDIIHPVIINDCNTLIDGYATFMMLKRNGEKFVPYIRSEKARPRYVTPNMRKQLYIEQNGKCYICGRYTHLDGTKEDGLRATVDHVLPLDKGGETVKSNIKIACNLCNSLKANFRYSNSLKDVLLTELKDRGLL